MLDNSQVTLRHVANALGVSRQCVAVMVGPLGRPTCAEPGPRPAPKREATRRGLAEMRRRVAAGESANAVARALGISTNTAWHLGFRAKEHFHPHGSQETLTAGCNCWRCRRAAGLALSRGPRVNAAQKAEVLDWLAWTDPEDGSRLSQAKIGLLVGVGQGTVSYVAQSQK